MGRVTEAGVDPFHSPATGDANRVASSRGMIVALIGPDGVGKSRQTAQLASIFQEKYRCTAIYLGSGDDGWKFPRAVQRYIRKWNPSRARRNSDVQVQLTRREFATSHSIITGLSGLVIGFERYVKLRRAIRLADSGSIVISDRWPQNLQPGLFDGPFRVHPLASRAVRLLSRLECALYRKMETYKPEVTIHLVSDFETSNARKPGDRTPAEFHQRLSLMQEMRTRDPTIKVVDAKNGFDEVTRDLSNWIWLALSERTDQS